MLVTSLGYVTRNIRKYKMNYSVRYEVDSFKLIDRPMERTHEVAYFITGVDKNDKCYNIVISSLNDCDRGP